MHVKGYGVDTARPAVEQNLGSLQICSMKELKRVAGGSVGCWAGRGTVSTIFVAYHHVQLLGGAPVVTEACGAVEDSLDRAGRVLAVSTQ